MIKKEWKFMDKKNRQYRSNQGRSPERTEKVYLGCLWTFLTFILVFVISLVLNYLTK